MVAVERTRKRHRNTSLSSSLSSSLSPKLKLLLMVSMGATTAAVFSSGSGSTGLPHAPLAHMRSDHWTSRSRQDASGDEPSCYSDEDGRSVNGDARARMERQVQRELREMFGDEFCDQLDEEAEMIEHAHENKARVGREAGCSPTSPLSSARSSLTLGPLVPEGEDGNGYRGSPGRSEESRSVITDWLR